MYIKEAQFKMFHLLVKISSTAFTFGRNLTKESCNLAEKVMENPDFVFKDRRLPSHKSLTVPLCGSINSVIHNLK